jgi:hypothetical protein
MAGRAKLLRFHSRIGSPARYRWLRPVILATKEVEIRRIVVPSQPQKIVCKTLSQKKKKIITKKSWWFKVYMLS